MLCNVTTEHDYANDIIVVRARHGAAAGEEFLYDCERPDDELARTYGIAPDA